MLSKALIVTGGAFWAFIAVSLGLGILNRPRVRRWLERPGLYPYTHWFRARSQGAMLHVLARLSPAGSPLRHARRVVHIGEVFAESDFHGSVRDGAGRLLVGKSYTNKLSFVVILRWRLQDLGKKHLWS